MTTLSNKKKISAINRDTHEENPRNNQAQDTVVSRNQEVYITQVSEDIESRVAKKLSQEFRRTKSRILWVLSKRNEFLLDPQVRVHSGPDLETSRNSKGENQKKLRIVPRIILILNWLSFWVSPPRNSAQTRLPKKNFNEKFTLLSEFLPFFLFLFSQTSNLDNGSVRLVPYFVSDSLPTYLSLNLWIHCHTYVFESFPFSFYWLTAVFFLFAVYNRCPIEFWEDASLCFKYAANLRLTECVLFCVFLLHLFWNEAPFRICFSMFASFGNKNSGLFCRMKLTWGPRYHSGSSLIGQQLPGLVFRYSDMKLHSFCNWNKLWQCRFRDFL